MPGATRPTHPWERDERETTNRLELTTEWRCGLPTALRDAATTLAACSPPGQWRHERQAMKNDEEPHRREPSGRRGRRERPGARRELGDRPPWMQRSGGTQTSGGNIPAHPYLVRQMLDFGFRQNPYGSNSRVRVKIFLLSI